MYRLGIFLFGIVLVLASCEARSISIDAPDDLIPRDSFTHVLTDLVVLEAHVQGKYVQLNNYTQIMIASGDSLLSKHGVDYDRFQSSLLYYGKFPDQMEEILTQISDTLTIREVQLPK